MQGEAQQQVSKSPEKNAAADAPKLPVPHLDGQPALAVLDVRVGARGRQSLSHIQPALACGAEVRLASCCKQQSGLTPSSSNKASRLAPPRWATGDGWPSDGGRVPGAQPAAYPGNVCWPSPPAQAHQRTGAARCCHCCSAHRSRRPRQAAHPQPRCGRLRQGECRNEQGFFSSGSRNSVACTQHDPKPSASPYTAAPTINRMQATSRT